MAAAAAAAGDVGARVAATRAAVRAVGDHEVARVRGLLKEGRLALSAAPSGPAYASAWESWVEALLVEIVPKWGVALDEADAADLVDAVAIDLAPAAWRTLAVAGECAAASPAACARIAKKAFRDEIEGLGMALREACDDEFASERAVEAAVRLPTRLANGLGKRCPSRLGRDEWLEAAARGVATRCGDRPAWAARALGRISRAGGALASALAASPSASIVAALDSRSLEAAAVGALGLADARARSFVDEALGPAVRTSRVARRVVAVRLATGATRSLPDRAAALVVRCCRVDADVLREATSNALRLWADADFVRTADERRKRFVSLVALYAILAEKPDEDHVPLVVGGVSARLESTASSDRREGMLVGEAFAKAVDQKLHFDDLSDEDRSHARRYLPDVAGSSRAEESDADALRPEREEEAPRAAATLPAAAPSCRPRQPRPDDLVLSGSESEPDGTEDADATDAESDDDLEPYDLADDGDDLAPIKAPRCARDLVELLDGRLEDTEARDRHVAALASCVDLVRSRPADLADVARKLAESLLHADNYFALENFADRATASLGSLAAQEPHAVVKAYLAPHFFGGDLTLTKRLAILDVMCLAARELAGRLEEDDGVAQRAPLLVDDSAARTSGKRSLVPADGKKTTRWGYRRNKPPVASVNRFGEVATTCFFFPLLLGYSQHPDYIKSSFAAFLKTKVVSTLCCFVDCARSTPVAHGLASHLLAFAWPDADSPEPALRRSALLAALTALSTAHDSTHQLDLLAANPDAPSYEALLNRVQAALQDDPDPGVRQVAAALGSTLPKLLI